MDALIIGADSVIGRALHQAMMRRGDRVVGTTRRAPGAAGLLPLNLADAAIGDWPLPEVEVAFFAAAMTRMADCRANPALARQINAVAPIALAQRLTERGVRVVLLSTNAVFDGMIADVPDSAPVRPVSDYGRFKAAAEAAFLALGPAASVLRLGKVITADRGVLRNWIDALWQGQPVRAFSDHHFAPITLEHAVSALIAIAEDRSGGIYQFTSTRDLTYAAAARVLATMVGVDPGLVHDQLAIAGGLDPSEVIRCGTMDSRRVARLLGCEPPQSEDVIRQVHAPLVDTLRGAA